MLKSAVLYTALILAANVAAADPALEDLAQGDMRKLAFHDTPRLVPDVVLSNLDGGEVRLADYAGAPVVLNFWATWCAPCRQEMPSLDRLQAEMGGRLEVVTVATGRNAPAGIRRFFEEEGIERLPMLTDPDQSFSREMGVLGLPVTVILDANGQEIARLTGGAEWDSEDAKLLLEAVLE
ncbi:TlpA family protein disulfide reductase [Roseitranquillus sediminis]|uniref:TlpA family protein disulfide reductase n=1 Tax=Roseitranquillus sediminis TaxID=2809051 RepID=UPI001D0C096B|nr:TlpA disulfide reductase family protein [Roseitranquillus sediminis]